MSNKKSEQSGKRVTLRDIATVAGVSHVAVSHALRNRAQVSAETRNRIIKIAEEMGYQPDPMLAALSQYRMSIRDNPVQASLALINPLKNPDDLHVQKELDLYCHGAKQAAKKLGYSIEEFRTSELSLKRMESMFKTRNIQGIILAKTLPLSYQDESIDWHDFSWHDFATVRFGRKTDFPEAHFVTSSQTSNTIKAFGKIAKKGYQRI